MVSYNEYAEGTDGQTERHHTVKLRFPIVIIFQTYYEKLCPHIEIPSNI